MKLLDDQELHPLVFATRMAVMAFVRATCSRSGSVCKFWFDRAGKMLYSNIREYWCEYNSPIFANIYRTGAHNHGLTRARTSSNGLQSASRAVVEAFHGPRYL